MAKVATKELCGFNGEAYLPIDTRWLWEWRGDFEVLLLVLWCLCSIDRGEMHASGPLEPSPRDLRYLARFQPGEQAYTWSVEQQLLNNFDVVLYNKYV